MNSNNYVSMGARIRELRKKKRLTQERLAERVDISTPFLGHIERGNRTPSLETLVRIANALETTLDVLLCDLITIRSPANIPTYVRQTFTELRRCTNALGEYFNV